MSRPTETLDSSATGANHSNRQHSLRGIVSVILSLVGSAPYVWFFINYYGLGVLGGRRGIATEDTGYEGPGSGMIVDPMTLLFFALLFLSPFFLLTGLSFGIEELKKANQKRIFPVIGIGISLSIVLIIFFNILALSSYKR